mmetsp:Transcript_981/g.2554  ORF Transcript_981/g.2554 Transcript_981/m.2554 type:complete len:210 (-) Transcript_981:211-840(-)
MHAQVRIGDRPRLLVAEDHLAVVARRAAHEDRRARRAPLLDLHARHLPRERTHAILAERAALGERGDHGVDLGGRDVLLALHDRVRPLCQLLLVLFAQLVLRSDGRVGDEVDHVAHLLPVGELRHAELLQRRQELGAVVPDELDEPCDRLLLERFLQVREPFLLQPRHEVRLRLERPRLLSRLEVRDRLLARPPAHLVQVDGDVVRQQL